MKNGQPIDTDNIGNKTQNTDKNTQKAKCMSMADPIRKLGVNPIK